MRRRWRRRRADAGLIAQTLQAKPIFGRRAETAACGRRSRSLMRRRVAHKAKTGVRSELTDRRRTPAAAHLALRIRRRRRWDAARPHLRALTGERSFLVWETRAGLQRSTDQHCQKGDRRTEDIGNSRGGKTGCSSALGRGVQSYVAAHQINAPSLRLANHKIFRVRATESAVGRAIGRAQAHAPRPRSRRMLQSARDPEHPPKLHGRQYDHQQGPDDEGEGDGGRTAAIAREVPFAACDHSVCTVAVASMRPLSMTPKDENKGWYKRDPDKMTNFPA